MEELRLSAAFVNETDEPNLELKCKVYNINPGMNDEMLSRCPALYGYTEFIEKIRDKERAGTAHPVEEALDWCMEYGVLKEFLQRRKSEVLKEMTIDMTFERREELIRRDEREGGKLELLQEMIQAQEITEENAANRLGITVEEFQKKVKAEELGEIPFDMTFERSEELIRRDEREEGREEGRKEGRKEERHLLFIAVQGLQEQKDENWFKDNNIDDETMKMARQLLATMRLTTES